MAVAATEMIITVIWSNPMLTPRNRTVLVSRNDGKEVLESPYQISPKPTMKIRIPTVETTFKVAVAFSSVRATSSRTRPSSGESTKRQRAAA